MSLKQLEKMCLIRLPDALEVQDLAEIGIGLVGNVNEVRLDKRFRRGGTHLQRLQDGVNAGHSLRDALDITWWSRRFRL